MTKKWNYQNGMKQTYLNYSILYFPRINSLCIMPWLVCMGPRLYWLLYRTQPSAINFTESRHYVWVIFPIFVALSEYIDLIFSMTTLLTHTVAHSTKPSFVPKTNNQPPKKFLSLALSWAKVVKNGKILTFKVNFLRQKISESF